MNTRIRISVCLLTALLLPGIGCMDIPPADGNPSDPLSSNYVPTAPLVYAYAATTSSIMVAWHDRSLGEDGFEIERRDTQLAFEPVGRVGANVYSFLDTSRVLTRGQTYYYRVRAFTAHHFSEYSDEVSVRLF